MFFKNSIFGCNCNLLQCNNRLCINGGNLFIYFSNIYTGSLISKASLNQSPVIQIFKYCFVHIQISPTSQHILLRV